MPKPWKLYYLVPDSRLHRGPHPQDLELFSPAKAPILAAAAKDLYWLLSRGYARESALKLTGDRYALTQRQRTACSRACCSAESRTLRLAKKSTPPPHSAIYIDGYNLITSIEAALSGGLVLKCQDSTFRDMASMQGTYRKVQETAAALDIIAKALSALPAGDCLFLLDKPVSNSGRLRDLILKAGRANALSWQVDLVKDPDSVLVTRPEVIVSSDSHILDKCSRWHNLARRAVEQYVPKAWVLDLSVDLEAG